MALARVSSSDFVARSRRQAWRGRASRRTSSSVSEVFLPAMPAWPLCAVAMRSCCSLMPRLRVLDLIVEVCLDLAGRALRRGGELVELAVVGVPAVALEQRLASARSAGSSSCRRCRQRCRRPGFVRAAANALALVLGEDDVEAAVEGEEHRGRHAGEEHHPEHRILGDDAQSLRVRRDDVAAGEHGEQAKRAEEQRRRRSRLWIQRSVAMPWRELVEAPATASSTTPTAR